ncbi:MAG: GNAT family N-acetyltransferase [Sneathiella sp.]|uniref:GNAT family N-acetyltransferase n=1 Tax=Sneathiella sp. TaxID=1964365 RepID=UPI0030033183
MGVFPEFTTDRMLLRDVSLADAPSWTEHFADYDVIRHLHAHVPWPYPENGVRDHISTKVLPQQGQDCWNWALCLKEDPQTVIGGISLWRAPRPDNRGFWLGKKFWGRGLMTEALTPVMDHAFTKLAFESVILSNAVSNQRSRRLKEKAGAQLIGIEPAEFVDPLSKERELWRLTKDAWFSNK